MAFELFVNGGLMRGLNAHHNLAGAEFVGEARTAPRYRIHSINDKHPGMYEVEVGGVSVPGEIYRVPEELWSALASSEPPNLYRGRVVLEDGREIFGILYPRQLAEGRQKDISSYGGWRSYVSAIRITIGALEFTARLEMEAAPNTCAAILQLLPFTNKLIQTRWSGEAAWVPLGDLALTVGYENHTSYPAPGEILAYTGDLSETELLLSFGACRFASKMGQLAGNHFATIVTGREQLKEVARLVLWQGAQDIRIERRHSEGIS